MTEKVFEDQLAALLQTYAEQGTRSFDSRAVAQAVIASRRSTRRLTLPSWQGRRARTLRLVLTMALMLAALVTALLVTGGLLPGGDRTAATGLFVWADGQATFIGADGSIVTRSAPSPRSDGCPVLLGGTGVISQVGFQGLQMHDLIGQSPPDAIRTDYTGGEHWSPDHRRVAQRDLDGTLTVVALDDAGQWQRETIDAPGIAWVEWSGDSRHLAVASRIAGATAVEILDVSADPIRTMRTFTLDGVKADIGMLIALSPDAASIVMREPLTSATQSTLKAWLGDVGTGAIIALDGALDQASGTAFAWDPESTRLAIANGRGLTFIDRRGVVDRRDVPGTGAIESLGWAPDARHLVLADGDGITVTDRVGNVQAQLSSTQPPSSLSRAAYVWAPDGSRLYVASAGTSPDGAASIIIQRYGLDLSPDGEPVVVPGKPSLDGQVCFARSDVAVGSDGGLDLP